MPNELDNVSRSSHVERDSPAIEIQFPENLEGLSAEARGKIAERKERASVLRTG